MTAPRTLMADAKDEALEKARAELERVGKPLNGYNPHEYFIVAATLTPTQLGAVITAIDAALAERSRA